jgi:hypothetical protein
VRGRAEYGAPLTEATANGRTARQVFDLPKPDSEKAKLEYAGDLVGGSNRPGL